MAQLVFRDGPREVPEHVGNMLKGIEIHRLTYSEAIAEANLKAQNEYVSKTINSMIANHFRQTGGR